MKHKHHIIPRHAGGSDDSTNLVELTVEEHAEAHKKLWEETNSNADLLAYKALSGQIGKEEIQLERSRLGGLSRKGIKHPPRSLESRKLIASIRTGTKSSIESSEKKRIAMRGNIHLLGHKHSEQTKSQMSQTHKLRGTGQKVGFKHSEKTKARMRISHLARNAHNRAFGA